MKERKTVGRKGGWLSQVQPGVPFTLVEEAPKVEKPGKRKERSLRDLGKLMTVAEVAEYLRVNRWTVYDWIYQEKLRKTPVGSHIRIAVSDLEDFLSCA